MRNVLPLVFLFMLITFAVQAQRFTISGYISDANSGERLPNANLFEKNTLQGTSANSYGFFSISLPAGEHTLVTSYVGYASQEFPIKLSGDLTLNIELEANTGQLDEITVVGNQQNKVEETQMSMIDLPVQKLQKVPVIMGEADVLKVIQLLPGVQGGTEGTSGIYVRGGGPDQNLFLLDGVPVYNAGHLLGFFSVFNPDAIKTVKLYKGGFPSRYGGRLSSVVDISMKDGNMKELKGDFSIGLISSKLTLEGPIIKDKTSFMVSARRTYVDVLAKPVIAFFNKTEDTNVKAGAYFHDYNLKLNHIFSERSRLYWSGYHGRDQGYGGDEYDNGWGNNEVTREYTDQFGLGWGNTISSLRWNYLISPKLFSNTTVTYSHYNFDMEYLYRTEDVVEDKKEEEYFNYSSGIRDLTAKADFDYFASPKHAIKFGLAYTNHYFTPGVTTVKLEDTMYEEASIDTTFGNRNIRANELAAYIEDDITIGAKLKLNAGLHLSTFIVDNETFVRPQPRLSLRYKGGENWSVKSSYSRMAQHVHLLTTSGINLPTDLWVPVTKRFEPPISDQVALGTAINFNHGLNFTLEGFYKSMTNLIEYKDGASFMGSGTNWEDKVEKGRGWSYGIEAMLEKTVGKTTGWIGYTWSKTERKFPNINYGQTFPAKYDRRHDVSIVLTHKFNDRFDIGATWVYGSGNTATVGFSHYPVAPIPNSWGSGSKLRHYSTRNNYRLPAYQRMDVGMNFHKQKKHGIRTWSISAYNAYNQKNPFIIYWKEDYNNPVIIEDGNYSYYTYEKKLVKLSIFPIIPSVSYSFKF